VNIQMQDAILNVIKQTDGFVTTDELIRRVEKKYKEKVANKSTFSKHLRLLRTAGFLRRRKRQDFGGTTFKNQYVHARTDKKTL